MPVNMAAGTPTGFTGHVQEFDDVTPQEFATTPSQRPRDRSPEADDGPPADGMADLTLRLPYRTPFATSPLVRFLAGHAVPGHARHDPISGAHTRTVPTPHGPAVVTLAFEEPGHVTVRLRAVDDADVPLVVARVRRWLALDADPLPVDRALSADPLLAPLVAARPGLRVPGAVDGAETALLAVLGQQVSLAAARTFAGRLVAAFGPPAPEGLTAFPTPATLAAAGPQELREATGVTGARARTLHAVATATADGLELDPGADRTATRAALLALPGIGPWTSEYIALRALGDPDAFPSGDLVLRRALGTPTARLAEERAEPWRPWRGYALLHLWTREVFA